MISILIAVSIVLFTIIAIIGYEAYADHEVICATYESCKSKAESYSHSSDHYRERMRVISSLIYENGTISREELGSLPYQLAHCKTNMTHAESVIVDHETTIADHEATIAAHESTIAGHESTIDLHENTIRTFHGFNMTVAPDQTAVLLEKDKIIANLEQINTLNQRLITEFLDGFDGW